MEVNNEELKTTPEPSDVVKMRANLARLQAQCVSESHNVQTLRREAVQMVDQIEDHRKAIIFYQGEIDALKDQKLLISDSVDILKKEQDELVVKNSELKSEITTQTASLEEEKRKIEEDKQILLEKSVELGKREQLLSDKELKIDEKIIQLNSVLTTI